MGLFGKKKKILALDLGAYSIKYALLSQAGKGSIKVDLAGSQLVPEQEVGSNELEGLTMALKTLVEDLDLQKKKLTQIIFSLPSSLAIVRYVTLPPTPPERVKMILRSEAEQHIPFSLADVALDTQILRTDDQGVEALITAIKQEKVDDYIHMITVAGLSPEIVDISAFALFNVFRFIEGEKLRLKDDADVAAPVDGDGEDGTEDGSGESSAKGGEPTVALLDIGANTTDIIVCQENNFFFTRSVAISGNSFTEAVMKRLGCSAAEAEQYKIVQGKARLEQDLKQDERPSGSSVPVGIPRAPGVPRAPGGDAPAAPAAPKLSIGLPKASDEPEETPAAVTKLKIGLPKKGEAESQTETSPASPAPPKVPGLALPKPPADGTPLAPPKAPGLAPPKPPADGAPPAPPKAPGLAPPKPPADGAPPAPPKAPGLAPPKPPADGAPLAPPKAPGLAPPKPPADGAPLAPPKPPGLAPPKPPADGAPPAPPKAPGLAPPKPPADGAPLAPPKPPGLAPPKPPADGAAPAPPKPPGLAPPKPPADGAAPALPSTPGLAPPKPPAAPGLAPPKPPSAPAPAASPAVPSGGLTLPPAAPAPPSGGFRLGGGAGAADAAPKVPGVSKMMGNKISSEMAKSEDVPKIRKGMLKTSAETPPPDGSDGPGGNSLGAAKAEETESIDAGITLEDRSKDVESAIKPLLDRLVSELKRSFDYYRSQMNGSDVTTIYLCGGGAQMQDLDQFLRQKTGLDIRVLNPLEKFSAEGVDVGPELAVALGLGLRVIDHECPIANNLLPADIAVRKRGLVRQRNLTILGVLGAVVFLELAGAGYMIYNQRVDELDTINNRLNELERVVKQVEELKQVRDELSERKNLIRTLSMERARWLDVLAELNNILALMPEDVWLSSLTFPNKTSGAISGQTGTYEAVGELNAALDASPYFTVEGYPTPTKDSRTGLVKFTFNFLVQQSPFQQEELEDGEEEFTEGEE